MVTEEQPDTLLCYQCSHPQKETRNRENHVNTGLLPLLPVFPERNIDSGINKEAAPADDPLTDWNDDDEPWTGPAEVVI